MTEASTLERKSPLAMTNNELQREADSLARRVAHGTTTIADSSLVIEMANRLIRYTPATERDKT